MQSASLQMSTTAFTVPPLPLRRLASTCPKRRVRRQQVCQLQDHATTSKTPISSSDDNSEITFADLQPPLPEELLTRMSSLYQHPTPTQKLALPPLLRGEDVLLHAPTGTGKTLCYLLTCLAHINPTRASAQALILVPTPELGAQVLHVMKKLSDLPYAALLNDDARAQRMALRTGPRIVLGTPVKVWDMSRFVRLDLVRILIADEFDSCLGNSEATRALVGILSVTPREGRQTVLCSATVPQHRYFLRRAMREGWLAKNVVHVRGKGEIVVPKGIQHAYVVCEQDRKIEAVAAVVRRFKGQVVVFVSETRDIDSVVTMLDSMVEGGVVGIRREWSAGERRHVMKKFRDGLVRTLVATDIAARGIDVPQVVGVVQTDLPRDAEGYLHRAGRAGRMGRRGWSVLVIAPGEGFVVDRFANFLDINFRELGTKR